MGTSIIVLLLVPLMIQMFILRHKQKKRHRELRERLTPIEEKMGLSTEPV